MQLRTSRVSSKNLSWPVDIRQAFKLSKNLWPFSCSSHYMHIDSFASFDCRSFHFSSLTLAFRLLKMPKELLTKKESMPVLRLKVLGQQCKEYNKPFMSTKNYLEEQRSRCQWSVDLRCYIIAFKLVFSNIFSSFYLITN